MVMCCMRAVDEQTELNEQSSKLFNLLQEGEASDLMNRFDTGFIES